MLILIKSCICLVLGFIAWQDFKYRGVSWYLFVIALILLMGQFFLSTGEIFDYRYFITGRLLNLFFIVFNVLIVSLVLIPKNLSFKRLLNDYLGMGDILFFVFLALALPFPLFILFFLLSTLISLLMGISVFKRSTIPLAGLQALLLIIIWWFDVEALNQVIIDNILVYG